MNKEEHNRLIGRHYYIEEIFEDFCEYEEYLKKALSLFQNLQKKRSPSFKNYIPQYLEVEFNKSIKAPRLYFPRYEGVIVVQLPDPKFSPKKKGSIRERALMQYVSLVKTNELALGDEFAMRMKIFSKKEG